MRAGGVSSPGEITPSLFSRLEHSHHGECSQPSPPAPSPSPSPPVPAESVRWRSNRRLDGLSSALPSEQAVNLCSALSGRLPSQLYPGRKAAHPPHSPPPPSCPLSPCSARLAGRGGCRLNDCPVSRIPASICGGVVLLGGGGGARSLTHACIHAHADAKEKKR